MAHLFFSYAHADYERLIGFRRLLEVRTGRMVWIDKLGLQRDAAWADMIQRAIEGSYGVIFAITETFVDAPNRPFIHTKEIPWALTRFNDSRQGALLFAVRFDDVPLPASLADTSLKHTLVTIDAFGKTSDAVIAELAPRLPEAKAGSQPFVVSWDRLRNFKGRDDALIDLHGKLFTEDGVVGIRTAGLHGMGGIGKTQLAAQYAHLFRFYYPKGVFWINAAEDWKAGFAACADRLELPGIEITDRDDRAGGKVIALKKYLRSLDGDALIIMDNVDNPASMSGRSIAPLLTVPALCAEVNARLLITTRVNVLPTGFLPVSVGVLTAEDALDVLLYAWQPDEVEMPRQDEPDTVSLKEIARRLGYLPLPLQWMASALYQRSDFAPAELLAELQSYGVDEVIDTLEDEQVTLQSPDYQEQVKANRYVARVNAALQWQLDQAKHRSPEAMRLIALTAAYGEAQVISIARLKLLLGLPEQGIRKPFFNADKALHDFSLLESQDGGRGVRLHPLTREYVRREFDAVAQLAAAVPELVHAYRDPVVIDREMTARGAADAIADLEDTSAALPSSDADLTRLLRLYWLESHRLLNSPSEPGAAYAMQHLRDRAHHEGDDMLRAACDVWLAGHAHIRAIDTVRHPTSPYLLRTLTVNGGISLAIQLHDSRILSWSDAGTLHLWTRDGTLISKFEHTEGKITGAIQLNDGRVVTWGEGNKLVFWSLDFVIQSVAFTSKEAIRSVEAKDDGTFQTVSSPIVHSVREISEAREVWEVWVSNSTVSSYEIQPVTSQTRFSPRARDIRKHFREMETIQGEIPLQNGGTGIWLHDDGDIFLYHPENDKYLRVKAHGTSVEGLIQLENGLLVSWASQDGRIQVWSEDGNRFAALEGHTQEINKVIELAGFDDTHLLSSSWDRSLRLWRVPPEPDGGPIDNRQEIFALHSMVQEMCITWVHGSFQIWNKDRQLVSSFEPTSDGGWDFYTLRNGSLLAWKKGFTGSCWILRSGELTINPYLTAPLESELVRGFVELADGRLLYYTERGEVFELIVDVNDYTSRMSSRLFFKFQHPDFPDDSVIGGIHQFTADRLLIWYETRIFLIADITGRIIDVYDTNALLIHGATAIPNHFFILWYPQEDTGKFLRPDVIIVWSSDEELQAVFSGHTNKVWNVWFLEDNTFLSHGGEGYRRWTIDGTQIGDVLTWREMLNIPRLREGNLRWWDHRGDTLVRGDFTVGRVDALYVHDAPIRQIAPLSPTRCAFTDEGARLHIVEFHDGQVTVR